MNMIELASYAGTTDRVRRRHDNRHAADRGDVELETLATAQPRSIDHLDLRQLVVPVADTVDGLRPQMVAAPEFPDPEFRGSRNAYKYIAPRPQDASGVDR
jgi:hypothetical protein